jgi:hypothetical protein
VADDITTSFQRINDALDQLGYDQGQFWRTLPGGDKGRPPEEVVSQGLHRVEGLMRQHDLDPKLFWQNLYQSDTPASPAPSPSPAASPSPAGSPSPDASASPAASPSPVPPPSPASPSTPAPGIKNWQHQQVDPKDISDAGSGDGDPGFGSGQVLASAPTDSGAPGDDGGFGSGAGDGDGGGTIDLSGVDDPGPLADAPPVDMPTDAPGMLASSPSMPTDSCSDLGGGMTDDTGGTTQLADASDSCGDSGMA